MNMFETLRVIDRFSELPENILAELETRGRLVTKARGETLFFEGDECSALYVLASGSIKIAKTLESGKELIIDILGPGEGIGEVALIDELPFPATASAHTDASVYVLSRNDYFSLLETYPALHRAIIRDLAQRLRMINRRMKDVSGGNVEYRIAHLFLTLGERAGRQEGGHILLDIPLSRQQIADMVGTSIETAIRIMSKWGKAGFLEATKTGFVILDQASLENIGESSL
jgi:CRP/FNR family transcriptional regulator, nitrogen oxide reductase regulator